MKKSVSIVFMGVLFAAVAVAMGTKEVSSDGQTTIKIGVPTAPPALPVLHIIEDKLLGDNTAINLVIWNSPEQLIAMVQDGSHDMFAFPLTVVATLRNRGLPVKLMNVNTWGVTYFMTTDSNFKSWNDLKGKTVYVPLRSSPPDALTQYFLHEAGLTVGTDVQVVYASQVEVAQALVSGAAQYATLIEPQVTVAQTKNPKVRRALSFESEWQRVTKSKTRIPNAGFGATESFIKKNPALARQFQQAYEESVRWVNENPDAAAALAAKYLNMPEAVVKKAIPNMGLHFESTKTAKAQLTAFYELLYSFDPAMIGGKLPSDDLLYEK